MANEEQILAVWEKVLRHAAWRWNLLGIDIKNEPHGYVCVWWCFVLGGWRCLVVCWMGGGVRYAYAF